jgi:serine/tyrosine/threonine adenylyltransferase
MSASPASQEPSTAIANPLLSLNYERSLESIGDAYYDPVPAAEFPQHLLRFRNDGVMRELFGIASQTVSDDHVVDCFGRFYGQEPFLALRYHGYQFGTYNPGLGDGRGFLYGQARGIDGELYDFGTKGSGRTPYSRTADGRLTLKGGVREVIASEALHFMGVRTSRTMSMIETGEALWRGDESSPTRSSVMVRVSRSHIRFGTFERLMAIQRPDLIQRLLDHVIEQYYPHLEKEGDRYPRFYAELVQRTAELVAQWMAVGFCHAVLNTDNMSITGESFDYGPYAFIPRYDLNFTAAYFDYYGRYAYGNQPSICHWNLEMLQRPLLAVIEPQAMTDALSTFQEHYLRAYREFMLRKLGFLANGDEIQEELLSLTLAILQSTPVGYHEFFATLRQEFNPLWATDPGHIFNESSLLQYPEIQAPLQVWAEQYHRLLWNDGEEAIATVADRLNRYNPLTVPLRPVIESVWEPIAQDDDWSLFYDLLYKLQTFT